MNDGHKFTIAEIDGSNPREMTFGEFKAMSRAACDAALGKLVKGGK